MNYDDIINLEHHQSTKHPHMSIYNRSAQFAPFAALTGYNEAIIETSRLTHDKILIDDGLKQILSDKLSIINQNLDKGWNIEITYFVKDKKKKGGSYQVVNGPIKKIDLFNEIIVMFDKTKIPIDDIIGISNEEIDKDDYL